MFLIAAADSTPIALVAQATTETPNSNGDDPAASPGVWCWMGFFEGATKTPITPGMVLRDWIMYDLDTRSPREDWTVVKVNRVTVKLTNGVRETTIRVDR